MAYRTTHVEEDLHAFPADAYRHRHYPGVAFYVLGWELEPDEDTEWSGCWQRTGWVLAVMVGDDHKHRCHPADLTELEPLAFCRSCGQIGCQCNVYE